MVKRELASVASFDPRPHASPPDSLPAFQAVEWEIGAMGVDIRPHVFEPVMGKWLLCDSGSQVSAFPPEPGDVEVKGTSLKAVNGSQIKCFGFKDVEIKIGRKTYKFKVIKADVSTPVLGWDFFRRHRLDFRWNEWGDMTLYDPLAQISHILTYKSLPFFDSIKHKKLAMVNEVPRVASNPKASRKLMAEVAAVKHGLGIGQVVLSQFEVETCN